MPEDPRKEMSFQAGGSQRRPVKKNEQLFNAFSDIPGSDYFSSLRDSSVIHHIDYFRHCNAHHSQKAYYHDLWGRKVLPIVEHSSVRHISDQYRRLKREWGETGATEGFWEQVLAGELSLRDELNQKRQLVAVRENAVDQLEDTYEYFSKRTRLSNDHDLDIFESGDSDSEEENRTDAFLHNPDPPQNIIELELPSSDPIDPSIHSDIFSDGTLEDSPPVGICRLVGPGTRTSELSGNSLYYKDDICVSKNLMGYRRRQVEDESFLQDCDIKNILSLNFVFFDPLILDLQEEQLARWRRCLGDGDKAFVVGLAEACCLQDREEALRSLYSLGAKLDLIASPFFLGAQSLMSTSVLWADTILVRDNEDSFIERFFKPLINAFFGQFVGARLCWTRDILKTGHVDAGELLYPDVMLSTTSTPQHTVLVGEVKKLDASDHDCHRDRVKLFTEMKRCLDGLLDYGVDGPVVGILAQRHRVEVWSMTLPYEALYVPTHLGSFDLILSRYYIGSFFALAPPLLAAKAAIHDTLTRLNQGRNRAPLKAEWRRGTYHHEPLILNDDVSIAQEARSLKKLVH